MKNSAFISIKDRSAEFFKGKKVTVMGLGLLGRGVGDAAYLAECGADLIVTDLKSPEELAPSLEKLSRFSNIRYVLGRHELSDFRGRDLIIKAAGVTEDSIYLNAARLSKTPVRMSADLFVELSGLPIIGVTGTRGKTTVTYMVHAVLTAAGVPAILAGNIPGVSTLSMLSQADGIQVAVLELDSWQLQGFRDSRQSPHIAVVTTFYSDHLSYYRHDLNKYLADKANIFLHQSKQDLLILGKQAMGSFTKKYPEVLERAMVVSESDVSSWKLKVPGVHNAYNAACARAAVLGFGIDESMVRLAIERFGGVPGRLELVGEKNGVRAYNDTTAVIPEATCAGLAALGPAPVTLIMGGRDKGNDIDALVDMLIRDNVRVILLPGTGSDRIAKRIPSATRTQSLHESVFEAIRSTPPGSVVLFSPAFSSLGTFANVFDRGDQFVSILNSLWTQ